MHFRPCLCYWQQQLKAARELQLIVLLHHIRPRWGWWGGGGGGDGDGGVFALSTKLKKCTALSNKRTRVKLDVKDVPFFSFFKPKLLTV